MDTAFLFQIENMHIFENVSFGSDFFPAVAVHKTGVYVFLEEEITKSVLGGKIYRLQQVLSCSLIKMNIYGNISGGCAQHYSAWTNNAESVPDMKEHVLERALSNAYCIDENHLEIMRDKLTFCRSSGKGDIRSDASGQRYVCKGSHWYPMSSEDQDEVFKWAFLLGWSGWYRFHIKKGLSGVLYLLSAGLFGVGYVCDLLLLALGNGRDEEGYFLASPSDKRKAACMVLASIAIALAVDFLYIKGYSLLSGAVLYSALNLTG